MNENEARIILAQELARYRTRTYNELALLDGQSEDFERVAPSGTAYQVVNQNLNGSSKDFPSDLPRRVAFPEGVDVNLQCDSDVRVSEALAHDLNVLTVFQKKSRARVTQVVESYCLGQSRPSNQRMNVVGDFLGDSCRTRENQLPC
ncbi:MAG: hypothetical protein QOE77_1593 [Blastocatellia bacterium]|jgi:hypothetical protein|nr:hypothetical protein [Blastocatellia bacterium]